METEFVDRLKLNSKLARAGEIIRNGGLVAFPTETVYGLGANGLDSEAVPKIYAAKGRPSDNPLILHISNITELNPLVTDVPELAIRLAEEFWPGPLTMIFKKSDIVPLVTTGNLDTVAIRMPSNKIARRLIEEAGVPVAAPSANTSGRPSPTKAEHVLEDLSGRIDMIIDGGEVDIGLESTIVDVTGKSPVILRPGFITKEMIKELIGRVDVDNAVTTLHPDKNLRPKAPGMKYKHYAPKGDMTIYKGNTENVVSAINKRIKEEGRGVAVLATDETKNRYHSDFVLSVGSRNNPDEIAHNLFNILREFDKMEAKVILSEGFDDSNLGFAIMNRLHKSAGYNIIRV